MINGSILQLITSLITSGADCDQVEGQTATRDETMYTLDVDGFFKLSACFFLHIIGDRKECNAQ